jgi:alkanesulfonate monooxygenase SsuD/methylene tetrahydromethanopterin reductase-like flavin-dependent oxidoreductase (luciferase family)
MPPVRPLVRPGPLGLIIRPVAPADVPGHRSRTTGTTPDRTSSTTRWITETCRQAEALGADALWATDHLFWGQPTLECMTSLAVAATATTRATLGTCILQLPLRRPPVVAKQATALQLLSSGRFVLGVGVGSHAGEYELAGADFDTRGAALDRGLEALRRAWATSEVPSARYRQEPSVPVPVWMGGSSAAARQRAARTGDGWIPLFVSPAQLADDIERLRAETAAAGRRPDAVQPGVVMVATVGSDCRRAAASGSAWLSSLYGIPAVAFERHLVAGPAEHCAEAAARYLDAGAEHVAVMVADDEPVGQFGELAAALAAHRAGSARVTGAAALAGADLAGVVA